MKWFTPFVLLVLALAFHTPCFAQDKTQECQLTLTYSVKPEINEKQNGEISLTVKSENRPFQVLWSSFDFKAETENIKGLKAGYYSVIVRDAEGCIGRIDNIQVTSNKTN
jgi:hypothetical protein